MHSSPLSGAMPLVSVIISTFNYGHYLPYALASALRQTFRDLEVVVVNDGSTDNTDECVRPFLADRRVRYVVQPNAGQARAKNVGIRSSRGQFVAFLDADDIWTSTKLEKQLPLFDNSRVGLAYSRVCCMDREESLFDIGRPPKYLQPKAGAVTGYLFHDNFVPFSTSVVRREILLEEGGFDESLKMGIDWELWLRVSLRACFAYVDEPLVLYRMGHPGQMSRNQQERQRSADRIMDRFRRDHQGALSRRTIRSAMSYTHVNRGDALFSVAPAAAVKRYLFRRGEIDMKRCRQTLRRPR